MHSNAIYLLNNTTMDCFIIVTNDLMVSELLTGVDSIFTTYLFLCMFVNSIESNRKLFKRWLWN